MSVNEKLISEYLTTFVNKSFIHKNPIIKNTKINELSHTSMTFLYKIYQEIKDNYYNIHQYGKLPDSIGIDELDINEIQEYLSKKKCKYIYENDMDSSSFFEKESKNIFSLKYTFSLQLNTNVTKKISVLFFLPMNPEEKQKVNVVLLRKYMDECFRKIYAWLCISYKHARNGCGNTLVVNIFMSNHNKILPESKEKKIGKIHVNTAYTTSCVENPEINVCREEEWFKCFIHETFHCLGLDFSAYNNHNELSKKHVTEVFPLKNTPVYLFETYCEMNAEIINILFYILVCHDRDIKRNSHDAMRSFSLIFKEKLLYEQLFSVFQAVKVLEHYDMNYNDLYANTIKCAEKRNGYTEETNVLSYYILKAIYMVFVDDFIMWMLNHNGLNNTFQYNNTEETTVRFCAIIKRRYLDSKLLKYIQFMENWIRNAKKNNVEYVTLRMSLHEM